MNLPDLLDRIFRPIAVPNLALALIVGQGLTFFLQIIRPEFAALLPLSWTLVLEGQWWRAVTFILVPPGPNFFALFYFWFFYFVGSAMEQIWGSTRLSAFIYTGIIIQAAAAALLPGQTFDCLFIEVTLLLALATYQPDFEILLFVFPVKLKYLALFHVILGVLYSLSGLVGLISTLGAMGNYLIFFFPHWRDRSKAFRRRNANRLRVSRSSDDGPRHVCHVCGIDSRTHPMMDFRYCSRCDGQKAYCEAHLKDHEHVVASDDLQFDRDRSG